MSESKEAYDKLKQAGVFDVIDKEVYDFLVAANRDMDARMAWNELVHLGSPVAKHSYNAVQQAFTRLTKSEKIAKVGTHKNPVTGFTTGLYRPKSQIKEPVSVPELF